MSMRPSSPTNSGRRSVLTVLCHVSPPYIDLLPHVDMVVSKKKKKRIIVLLLDGKCVYKDCQRFFSNRFHLQIFVRKPNYSNFETFENRDLTANE